MELPIYNGIPHLMLDEIALSEMGAKSETIVVGEGMSFVQVLWNGDMLKRLLREYILPLKAKGEKIAICGHTPNWCQSAIVCAMMPVPVLGCVGRPGDPRTRYADFVKPPFGELEFVNNRVVLTIMEHKIVRMQYNIASETGDYESFDKARLQYFRLPEVSHGMDMFITGLASNDVAASIAMGYRDICGSMWMKYHDEPGYTCLWSNKAGIEAGDYKADKDITA